MRKRYGLVISKAGPRTEVGAYLSAQQAGWLSQEALVTTAPRAPISIVATLLAARNYCMPLADKYVIATVTDYGPALDR